MTSTDSARRDGDYETWARIFRVRLATLRVERIDTADLAPIGSRRAQALLGGKPNLDSVDRLVVEAIRQRSAKPWSVSVVGCDAGSPWSAGWGFDAVRRRVWLREGRTVNLASHPTIARLLEAMLEHNGVLSREEIVRYVWGFSEYLPTRHNNRLFTAINKLRSLVEDEAAKPSRIVTRCDGYALGGEEAVRWFRSDETS